MKPLTRRQKYDYTDIDRGELKLIRVGHAIWALLRQERRRKSYLPSEERAIVKAIETMIRLKKEYRAELKVKRAASNLEVAERMRGRKR